MKKEKELEKLIKEAQQLLIYNEDLVKEIEAALVNSKDKSEKESIEKKLARVREIKY